MVAGGDIPLSVRVRRAVERRAAIVEAICGGEGGVEMRMEMGWVKRYVWWKCEMYEVEVESGEARGDLQSNGCQPSVTRNLDRPINQLQLSQTCTISIG